MEELRDYGFRQEGDWWVYRDGVRTVSARIELENWVHIILDFGGERWTVWDAPIECGVISALGCLVKNPFDDSFGG